MFSFDSKSNGQPIAIIKGGKFDKKTLYLVDEMTPIKSLDDLKNDEFFKKFQENMTLLRLSELRKALHEKTDLTTDLLKIYSDSRKSLKINDGKLEQLPSSKIIERLFIAGASGSGKSTYTGNYINRYKKMFKDRDVFLFTRNTEDKAVDKFKPIRIELNDELTEDPIELTEFNSSLVIFDDITTIPDKLIKNEVIRIREDLLECGRKENISVIVTNHNLLDYKNTRNLLNEATSVTFFPKGGGGTSQILGFLKRHCGMNNKEINKVMNLPSRWVTIFRNYPTYIMHERGVFML